MADEDVQVTMTRNASTACGSLDDARGLLKDAAKHVDRAGLPEQFHLEALELVERVGSFEARISEYAVEVAA
jgi:hypothetical protein